ncbi:MAG: trimethylamine methyltransferase family protein, partial [Anaerolineae bacterium]
KMSFSLKQLVLDNAVLPMVERVLRGITVDEETLALDLIEHVGPTGSFVTEDHTLAHHRDELLTCELIDHRPREVWEAAGALDMESRAQQEVERLLAEHYPPPLPRQVVAQLDEMVGAVEATDRSPS